MTSFMNSSSGEKTFGLEVEIHVAALRDGEDDPDPGDRRVPSRVGKDDPINPDQHKEQAEEIINDIISCVEQEGIIIQLSKYEHPIALDNASNGKTDQGRTVGARTPKGYYKVYEKWALCFDGSGAWYGGKEYRKPPVSPKNYVWFPLELKAPVHNNMGELHAELATIIKVIRDRYRVSIKCGRDSSRTSVHVHVGSTEAFELGTMKRLLTLMWVYEPVIMSLHASWKSNHVRYSSLLRTHSHLARLLGERLPDPPYVQSKRDKFALHEFILDPQLEKLYQDCIQAGDDEVSLRIIWGARDMEHLAWLAASQFGERRSALSLHSLAPVDSTLIHQTRTVSLGTIEFRHMQGSFDADDIMNWVRVVVRMVKAYEELTNVDFGNLIHKAKRTENPPNPREFFEGIGFGARSGEPLPRFKEQSDLDRETSTPADDGPFHDIFLPPIA